LIFSPLGTGEKSKEHTQRHKGPRELEKILTGPERGQWGGPSRMTGCRANRTRRSEHKNDSLPSNRRAGGKVSRTARRPYTQVIRRGALPQTSEPALRGSRYDLKNQQNEGTWRDPPNLSHRMRTQGWWQPRELDRE